MGLPLNFTFIFENSEIQDIDDRNSHLNDDKNVEIYFGYLEVNHSRIG
jgi:hypothetical protein